MLNVLLAVLVTAYLLVLLMPSRVLASSEFGRRVIANREELTVMCGWFVACAAARAGLVRLPRLAVEPVVIHSTRAGLVLGDGDVLIPDELFDATGTLPYMPLKSSHPWVRDTSVLRSAKIRGHCVLMRSELPIPVGGHASAQFLGLLDAAKLVVVYETSSMLVHDSCKYIKISGGAAVCIGGNVVLVGPVAGIVIADK